MFEAATGDCRRPHIVDIHVGERLRQRRKFLGLSQVQLADSLSLTFQQVQKYERGTNRISASKLYEAARYLKVPVTYFFEGIEAFNSDAMSETEASIHAFLATAEGIELAEAFSKMKSPKHRRRMLELVKALSDE